jgi:hypothetical protein
MNKNKYDELKEKFIKFWNNTPLYADAQFFILFNTKTKEFRVKHEFENIPAYIAVQNMKKKDNYVVYASAENYNAIFSFEDFIEDKILDNLIDGSELRYEDIDTICKELNLNKESIDQVHVEVDVPHAGDDSDDCFIDNYKDDLIFVLKDIPETKTSYLDYLKDRAKTIYNGIENNISYFEYNNQPKISL